MKKIFIMIAISAIIVIVSYLVINTFPLIPRLITKTILIIVFPVLLYFFNFYEKIELDRLKGAWKKWKNPGNWSNNIKSIKIK